MPCVVPHIVNPNPGATFLCGFVKKGAIKIEPLSRGYLFYVGLYGRSHLFKGNLCKPPDPLLEGR
jgi:hypothetical protein